jgi:hypothetical protein
MVKVTCDRCKKKYDEPADTPSSDGLLIDAKALDFDEIVFGDLCAKCKKRVADLVALIAKVKETDEDEEPATTGETQVSTPRPATRGRAQPAAQNEEKR